MRTSADFLFSMVGIYMVIYIYMRTIEKFNGSTERRRLLGVSDLTVVVVLDATVRAAASARANIFNYVYPQQDSSLSVYFVRPLTKCERDHCV